MKRKQSVPVLINSREDVIAAFTRGDVLKKKDRLSATVNFKGGRMSLKKACVIAIKYALGLISRKKINLHRLALAWLRLGQRVWQKICKVVQKPIASYQIGWVRFLQHFCAMFERRVRSTPAWTW